MLNTLKWKLMSFLRVINFLNIHPDEVDAIEEMADDVTVLKVAVTNIQAAEVIQGGDTKGITEDSRLKKKEMANICIQFAKKALPLARKANNNELIEKLDQNITYIYRAPKVDALARAKAIKTILVDNSALLSNILPADITKLEASIAAYDAAHINPIVARENKKIEGTESILDEVKIADEAEDNIFDFFCGYFMDTRPELITELEDCMGLEKEGIRHTGITAMCMDENPPASAITNLLQGAKINIVELNRTAISDIMGMCHILRVKTGTYHVEFSKEGFVTKQMILNIKRGRVLELEVKMVRVPTT